MTQALRVGLVDVLELEDVKYFSDPNLPVMSLGWDGASLPAQRLAVTILLSLKSVEASYPGFVKVNEVFEEDTGDDENE